MPCYQPEPTDSQYESAKVCQLIVIFDSKMGLETPEYIKKGTWEEEPNICNVVTPMLCEKIRSLTHEQMEEVVYGRNKDSRRLADWWEEHEKFDKERENN